MFLPPLYLLRLGAIARCRYMLPARGDMRRCRERAKGLRLLYDAPRRGTSNSKVNFVHPKDAGGVLVELVEPAADAH